MKKLIIAALLFIGFSSFAQDQNQPDKKPNNGQRERMSPEQRSQAQLDKLTTELKLDAKQQEQIKPILAEQTAKLQAMRDQRIASNSKELTSEERKALMQKRTEEKAATDAKLKTILTPEQFKKMKDNEAANREKMREAREARQNRTEQE
jgi:Spy/CpxP family protein refolding chaperone